MYELRGRLHVSRCTLGSLGCSIEHVLTSWNCMLAPGPTRFLQNSRRRALEWTYLTTNLELLPPPHLVQALGPTHSLHSALQRWVRSASSVSDQKPQDPSDAGQQPGGAGGPSRGGGRW